jgi:glycosyltransferase involved in cell wall biosynthesis
MAVAATVPEADTDVTPVSVVIRALNESKLIGRCLETLRAQPGGPDLEIVVVDSGSTDGTTEIARGYNAEIVEVAREAFDYSKSLNLGIEHTRGDLIVILSAHSIPCEPLWLELMTQPFDDPSVAGVCCRQVAWPDGEWHEKKRVAETFGGTPMVFEAGHTDGLIFSNAASCIRRGIWKDHRFDMPAAEDMDWAARVIDAGLRIVYEPRASVMHSHTDSLQRRAKRLVELSAAADIFAGRPRSRPRHARESAGLLAREVHDIWTLDDSVWTKARYSWESLRVATLFLIHFPYRAMRRRQSAAARSTGRSRGA